MGEDLVSPGPPLPTGLLTKRSLYSVDETIARLETAFVGTPVAVVGKIDHAAVAREAGFDLRPTTVLVFGASAQDTEVGHCIYGGLLATHLHNLHTGNPAVGTPVMQANSSCGIDLPMTALAYEDENGVVWLLYNDVMVSLQARHGLEPGGSASESISALASALETFTDRAVGPSARRSHGHHAKN